MTTIIGIDQSYARTGVAVAVDGSIRECQSFTMPSKKRGYNRRFLAAIVKSEIKKWNPDYIVVERVRFFARTNIVSLETMLVLSQLIAQIVDAADPVPVYSVDTRAWKAKVLGFPNATKDDAVAYAQTILHVEVDHDAADAAGIALYAFHAKKPLLRLEE